MMILIEELFDELKSNNLILENKLIDKVKVFYICFIIIEKLLKIRISTENQINNNLSIPFK